MKKSCIKTTKNNHDTSNSIRNTKDYRIKKDARIAVGIVDFDLQKGILKHVGIRGTAKTGAIDQNRLRRFVSKYLGENSNSWFVDHIVNPLDVMVEITPKSIVTKDVSFFKTGPHLAT